MLKALSLIVAGLLAGLAIAWVLPGDDTADDGELGAAADFLAATPRGATEDERFASLQAEVRSEAQARLMLEERVEALSAELAALRDEARLPQAGERAARAPGARGADMRGLEQRDGANPLEPVDGRLTLEDLRARADEREIERFVEAGFTRERAEVIRRRSDELQYEFMQAQFEARSAGQPVDNVPTRDQMLRRELGDADYERLLRATGRLTEVNVVDVLPSSPAERMGLKPGDRIVSYAGTRLFEIGELNRLTSQGNPAETVIVEVMRDGQPLQLALPRGPLGVTVQGNRSGSGPGGSAGPVGGFEGRVGFAR